jgi:hypothetical protein
MSSRNIVLWTLAAMLLIWLAAVAWNARACGVGGGQFSILGWRCVMPKPSVILRRELERG